MDIKRKVRIAIAQNHRDDAEQFGKGAMDLLRAMSAFRRQTAGFLRDAGPSLASMSGTITKIALEEAFKEGRRAIGLEADALEEAAKEIEKDLEKIAEDPNGFWEDELEKAKSSGMDDEEALSEVAEFRERWDYEDGFFVEKDDIIRALGNREREEEFVTKVAEEIGLHRVMVEKVSDRETLRRYDRRGILAEWLRCDPEDPLAIEDFLDVEYADWLDENYFEAKAAE